MIHSKKYTLKVIDFTKGAVLAFLVGGLTALKDALSSTPVSIRVVLATSVTAGIVAISGYLIKNFITNSEGKLAAEPKKEIQ